MLKQFFRSSQPALLFSLPIWVAVFWGIATGVALDIPVNENHMPLVKMLVGLLGTNKWVWLIFGGILVSLQGLQFHFLIERHSLINRKTYFPGIAYVILMSSFSAIHFSLPIILAQLFLLFAAERILRFAQKGSAFRDGFDAGFAIGLASMCFQSSALFLLLIFIGLLQFRTFNWREWMIPIVGFSVPMLYSAVYSLWNSGKFLPFPAGFQPMQLQLGANFSIALAIYFAVLGMNLILAIGPYFRSVSVNVARVRKSLVLMMWFLLIGLAAMLFTNSLSMGWLGILSLPFGLLFTNYYVFAKRKWLASVLFVLLIVSTLFLQLTR